MIIHYSYQRLEKEIINTFRLYDLQSYLMSLVVF